MTANKSHCFCVKPQLPVLLTLVVYWQVEPSTDGKLDFQCKRAGFHSGHL